MTTNSTLVEDNRLEIPIVVADGETIYGFWLSFGHDATGDDLFGLLETRLPHLVSERSVLLVDRTGDEIHKQTPLHEVQLVAGDLIRKGNTNAVLCSHPDHLHDDPDTGQVVLSFTDRWNTHARIGEPIEVSTATSIEIGRGAGSDVRFEECTVSRRHAQLSTTSSGPRLTDLDSQNGTFVNGERINRPIDLVPGDRIRFGDSEATVDLVGKSRRELVGPHLTPAAGRLRFNRPPRTIVSMPDAELQLPQPPDTPPKRRFPLAAALAPLGMGLLMAFMFSPRYAIFTALSPVLMAFSWIDDRRSGRKQFRIDSAAFRDGLVTLHRTVSDRSDAVAAWQRRRLPNMVTLAWWARAASSSLWTRRPQDDDFMSVAPADFATCSLLTLVDPTSGDAELMEELHEFVRTAPRAPSVPVEIDLLEDPVVGLCGSNDAAADCARSMVAALCSMVSPRFLQVAILAPTQPHNWSWASWLPHTTGNRASGQLIAGTDDEVGTIFEWLQKVVERRRTAQGSSVLGGSNAILPHLLLVLHGRVNVSPRALSHLMAEAADVGLSMLFVGSHEKDLPSETSVVVKVDENATDVTYTSTAKLHSATTRRLSTADAAAFARYLTPLVDVTAGSSAGDIPSAVPVATVIDETALNDDAIVRTWQSHDGSLGATIGATADSVFDLDLRRDGPHALVAGTTGSGKSEFLQSLVVGMAMRHSPQRLNFILVDYKGGSAFSECVSLPHTTGYVTNLDDRLAERVLISLRAELRRREHLLLAAGVKDLVSFERSDPAAAPPSLVVVIDEFAALKTEVPEFVDGLVDIAQRGRSMGVHMVLATQKPSGVITAQIEANTNIRVALRVASPSESTEVLADPRAAEISNRTPGRCMIKIGARVEDIIEVQSMYVNGHSFGDTEVPNVLQTYRYGMEGLNRPKPILTAAAHTDLEQLVAAASSAWESVGAPVLHRPWLPELRTLVGVAEVASYTSTEVPSRIPIGLGDRPSEHRQEPFLLDLDQQGNVVIYGAPGSGKTTLLRTIAVSMALQSRPDQAQVIGLDCTTGALAGIGNLPNVREVMNGRDLSEVKLLTELLSRDLDARRTAMTNLGIANLAEWRAKSAAAPPLVVVMVDGIGQLWAALDDDRQHQLSLDIIRLLADGRGVGIHFVLTADRRNAVPSQISSSIGLTLIQRMTNDDDYRHLNLQGEIPSHVPAGRTLTTDGDELQAAVCNMQHETGTEAQTGVIEELAAGLQPLVGAFAEPLPRLPERLFAGELVQAQRLEALPVGCTQFLDENLLNLERTPLVLVIGPSGSGRSTALELFAHQLRAIAPDRFAIAGRRGSLLAQSSAFTHMATSNCGARLDEIAAMISQRCEAGWDAPMLVAVDDADDYFDSAGSEAMATITRRATEAGVIVVASANNFLAANTYSAWVRMMRNVGSGVVLHPQSRDDTDVFGVSFPKIAVRSLPPGRGLLVEQRQASPVQLAYVPPFQRVEQEESATEPGNGDQYPFSAPPLQATM